MNDMFVHDRRDPASDLSYWIGPLSPAFAAMHADVTGSGTSPATQGAEGAALRTHIPPAASRPSEWIGAPTPSLAPDASMDQLRTLFHALHNQLGVVITYAELLEAKAPDEAARGRATQVLTAALEALGTSKQIRQTVIP